MTRPSFFMASIRSASITIGAFERWPGFPAGFAGAGLAAASGAFGAGVPAFGAGVLVWAPPDPTPAARPKATPTTALTRALRVMSHSLGTTPGWRWRDSR